MLAHLCPNLINLKGSFDSMEYLKAIEQQHREGHLQRLHFIRVPYLENATDIAIYHTTILEFRNTIKQITIVDGISNTISTQCLIPPTSLQLFTSTEHVHLREFSRVHLYRIKDYVSNCGPHVKSLWVKMPETTTVPLQDEFNGQSDVQPQENVSELKLFLQGITINELAFIMRMFPSLKRINFGVDVLNQIAFDRRDVQAIVQFFDYLSLITKVDCRFESHDISTGLGLLPHLAKLFELKELWLVSSNVIDHTKISIALLDLPYLFFEADGFTARSETKGLGVAIEICSTEPQASFVRALEGLQRESIESITIGNHRMRPAMLQQVKQQSLDYIVDLYKGMQDLTFRGVEFLLHAPQSRNQIVEYLRCLHLDECKITEYCYSRLSCQFKKIDCFKVSYSQWDIKNSLHKTKRIYLPYTTIKTVSLDTKLGFRSCHIIGAWTNTTCITLKATRDQPNKPITLKECNDEQLQISKSDVNKRIVGTLYCFYLVKKARSRPRKWCHRVLRRGITFWNTFQEFLGSLISSDFFACGSKAKFIDFKEWMFSP
ncbi:hypothetical protein MBANPS3_009666 [Mucor bainieri]